MVRIEDKMAEWNGELKFITEDGTEFILMPKLIHKRKLIYLEKKAADGKFEEKDVEEQDKVIEAIIKSAYPDFTNEQVEGVVQEYGLEIVMELYLAWKLRDKDAMDAFKIKQKQEIAKLLADDQESEIS